MELPQKILLVDDTVTVRMALKMMLASEGYTIQEAANGAEALDVARDFRPDVMLLDIVMPELDGISTCERLKSDADLRAIKVIMVTTKGDAGRIRAAMRAGCDGYVTKPVDKTSLLDEIRIVSGLPTQI